MTKYTVQEYIKEYDIKINELGLLLRGLQNLLKGNHGNKWDNSKVYNSSNAGKYHSVPFYLGVILTIIGLDEIEIDNMSIEEQITYCYLFL